MTINQLLAPYAIREGRKNGYAIYYRSTLLGYCPSPEYLTAVRVADSCREAGITGPERFGSADQINAYRNQGLGHIKRTIVDGPDTPCPHIDKIKRAEIAAGYWSYATDVA